MKTNKGKDNVVYLEMGVTETQLLQRKGLREIIKNGQRHIEVDPNYFKKLHEKNETADRDKFMLKNGLGDSDMINDNIPVDI